jgi:hypothetical protein
VRELLKLLAAISAVLFIIAGVFALLFFNMERKAFSSATYKQAFQDQKLYERMPALMASALQTSISQNPNAFPFLKELNTEDWQSTIASLLPPEEMRALADGALDSTFDYINGRTNSAVISLLPIKSQLAGPSGVTVIKQFLKTQPDCTLDQLTQMGLGLLGGDIALCNPPEQAMGLVEPLIQSQLQTISSAFPDQITIISSTENGTPNDPRYKLHLARSAMRFSPFFAILFLLAIALFAIRSLTDVLVWWGWPFLTVGIITTLIGLIGSPLVGWFLQFFIQRQAGALLPSVLASSISETASAVARQILIPVTIQGLVLGVIGFFMVLAGIFLTRRAAYQFYESY